MAGAVFDFAAFPTLTTERLRLREPVPADAADVFVFRSDSEVQKYNSAPMRAVADALALITEARAAYAARRRICWPARAGRRRTRASIRRCRGACWRRRRAPSP